MRIYVSPLLVVALAAPFLSARVALAQTRSAVWDSHAELRQWVSFPTGYPRGGVTGVTDLEEEGRRFVRIEWKDLNAFPRIGWPNDPRFDFKHLADLKPLLEPAIHNAVSITLRHTMTLDLLVGAWVHRNWEYDENLSTQPNFAPRVVSAGHEWTELRLRLSESPFFDPESDVVFMTFGMAAEGLTWEQIGNRYEALPADAYLDIDRIEFLTLPEDGSQPYILDFSPKRGYGGTIIRIQGGGFAEPAGTNVVAIGPYVATVISGGPTSLVIEAPSASTSQIGVLVPGGRAAVTNEPFEYLKNPAELSIVGGDGQAATVGTTLSPFQVKLVANDDSGIPDQKILFEVLEGQGALSNTESLTNELGVASTELTLGRETGLVRVEAVLEHLKEFRVLLTATATSK